MTPHAPATVLLRPTVALATCAGLALTLGACSSSANVDPPEISTSNDANVSTHDLCTDLSGQLPETVSGQPSRPTDPDSPLTAAWGDPAIVWRCGVPDPDALEPSSQLTSVNGVDWFAEELTNGYLFTTYGREANVEVTVPAVYAPEIGPVTELSSAVQQGDPERHSGRSESP